MRPLGLEPRSTLMIEQNFPYSMDANQFIKLNSVNKIRSLGFEPSSPDLFSDIIPINHKRYPIY